MGPVDRIKSVTVECGFTEGLLPSHESHHPVRVQPLPTLPAATSEGNGDTTPPIEAELPDMQSSHCERKIKHAVCFSDFPTIFPLDCRMLLRLQMHNLA